MLFDLSILASSLALAFVSIWMVGFKKSELSLYACLWLSCYLGYTFLIVGSTGSYVNFYILAAISATIAFLFANRGCSLNKRDRVACLIMYLPFVYNVGVSNEWLHVKYGAFDMYYTPFMQTTYICLLALSALNMLVEKIKLNIEKEDQANDDVGAMAVGSACYTEFSNSGGLLCDPNKVEIIS